MKYLPLLLLLLLSCEEESITLNQFVDERDGETYEYIEIGNQTWMTENLRYVTPAPADYYISNYGILYTWESANRICPAGWHLPTQDEWLQLIDYLGDNSGAALKESGFKVVYAGWYQVGEYSSKGRVGAWWSATEFDTYAWVYYVNEWDIIHHTNLLKTSKLTIRCVKD